MIDHEVKAPYDLPSLQQLDISGCHPNGFCSVAMPTLHILRLAKVGAGVVLFLNSLCGRSNLTELSLRSVAVDHVTLKALLLANPSLETLVVTHVGQDINDVVEFLTSRRPVGSDAAGTPSLTSVCPLLTHIDFSCSPRLTSRVIIDLVKLRLPVELPTVGAGSLEEPLILKAADPPVLKPIETLILDKCPLIEFEVQGWLRNRVQRFSCAYATAKEAGWKR